MMRVPCQHNRLARQLTLSGALGIAIIAEGALPISQSIAGRSGR